MDPSTTLCNLLDAITNNDREAVDEALEALRDWNIAGGFMPQIIRSNVDNHYYYRLDR